MASVSAFVSVCFKEPNPFVLPNATLNSSVANESLCDIPKK